MGLNTAKLVDLRCFRFSLILTNMPFRRFCMCMSGVSGVLVLGVSLLSADVAVVVVRPDVTAQRILICGSRTRTCWNRSEQAVTMVPLAQNGKKKIST
jgi:hypothetical protein